MCICKQTALEATQYVSKHVRGPNKMVVRPFASIETEVKKVPLKAHKTSPFGSCCFPWKMTTWQLCSQVALEAKLLNSWLIGTPVFSAAHM